MDIDADLDRIARQEDVLRFDRFDPTVAWDLGVALKAAAEVRGAGVAIDISLPGQTLFHHATTGATPDNTEWVRRKRNVTMRFYRSSYAIGLQLKRKGGSMESEHGLGADFMAYGGSFPIWLRSATCIGAITVSGLPQRDDHDLATRTLATFLRIAPEEIALA